MNMIEEPTLFCIAGVRLCSVKQNSKTGPTGHSALAGPSGRRNWCEQMGPIDRTVSYLEAKITDGVDLIV
ncbi:hypothetical protein [Ruegeria sp. SCP11]|uniref:hypothetical protein n=1 Tax=Ruegeria sp. SCP11 TaxID=3141378 RepID=UPI00333BE44E